ncbi:peptidase C39 [Mesobacillus zeae]|uniref:Peptidase C39 n=1 Tax=Mesobacillus zeae TaxID=1917180 RepID=A0A398BFU5_9BACI|nr:peptidase C39 [Mesobacillus zeae]
MFNLKAVMGLIMMPFLIGFCQDPSHIEKGSEPLAKSQHISSELTKQKPKSMVPSTVLLDVPLIKQNPELKYGCEVTSLAMLLSYAGKNVDKMELYQKLPKDPEPIHRTSTGDISRWGNPEHGFVGDMTGKEAGYAVFDKPLAHLLEQYLPEQSVNLTGKEFNEVLMHVSRGYPAVVWTTGDYGLPDRWEAWQHGESAIRTPLDLHAVVLVGHDQNFVYINDPLSGQKQAKVGKQRFIASWKALQSRAVSYHE